MGSRTLREKLTERLASKPASFGHPASHYSVGDAQFGAAVSDYLIACAGLPAAAADPRVFDFGSNLSATNTGPIAGPAGDHDMATLPASRTADR